MALRIIDGQPRQVFPVGELLLDGALEGVLIVALQIALHVSGDTLPQHLSAMLQIFLQTPVEHHYLVVRRAQGHQRDADDKRDDKSGAKQSHLARPPKPTVLRAISTPSITGNKRHCRMIPTADWTTAFRHAARSTGSRHETRAPDEALDELRFPQPLTRKDANFRVRRLSGEPTSLSLRSETR